MWWNRSTYNVDEAVDCDWFTELLSPSSGNVTVPICTISSLRVGTSSKAAAVMSKAAFQFQTIGGSTGIKWKIHMFHGIKPLTIRLAKNNNFYSHKGAFAWRRPHFRTQSSTHSQRNWLIWLIGSSCVRGRATVSEWLSDLFVQSSFSQQVGRGEAELKWENRAAAFPTRLTQPWTWYSWNSSDVLSFQVAS